MAAFMGRRYRLRLRNKDDHSDITCQNTGTIEEGPHIGSYRSVPYLHPRRRMFEFHPRLRHTRGPTVISVRCRAGAGGSCRRAPAPPYHAPRLANPGRHSLLRALPACHRRCWGYGKPVSADCGPAVRQATDRRPWPHWTAHHRTGAARISRSLSADWYRPWRHRSRGEPGRGQRRLRAARRTARRFRTDRKVDR